MRKALCASIWREGVVSTLFAIGLCLVLTMLTGAATAEDRWHPVLVDGFGTAWLIDLSTVSETSEGTEVWIKKIFDPIKSPEVFQKYQVRPSVYDVELWLMRPDRRASMLQVVRYDAQGRTVETYDYQASGKPPTRAIPPDSSLDRVWNLVMKAGSEKGP
jgi:hypothetical protein